MLPLLLPPNPVQHFYRGGDRIAALRGFVATTDRQPEEWLGSTLTRFGEGTVGLATTAEGEFLRDLIEADPAQWTGGPGRDAADTGILVKLLDARQRLPVHVHPGREFAAAHLDCPYGKTEAWYVLIRWMMVLCTWAGNTRWIATSLTVDATLKIANGCSAT